MHSVYVFSNSSDSYVSFYQGSRNSYYGTINVNETGSYSSSTYWRSTVSDTTPADHIITFIIRVTDSSGYQQYFYKATTVIGKSNYEIFDFHVIEYEGDGDSKVDAGEKWYADITIENNGEAINKEYKTIK